MIDRKSYPPMPKRFPPAPKPPPRPKSITTKDSSGNVNGHLIPLWNCHEHGWSPEQVYVTVVASGCSKGPHLHKVRHGRFVCVSGNVDVIYRKEDGLYYNQMTGDDYGYAVVSIKPGWAAELRNRGERPAFVVNMPTPAWRPDDQDEWPVEGWRP